MSNYQPKLIIVAVAPIYTGKILWIEQLFDFLSLFPNSDILLPEFTIQNQAWESNLIFSIIKEQYENVKNYAVQIEEVGDTKDFLENVKLTLDKIISYFEFKDEIVTLEQMNNKMYWLLANQFSMMLTNSYSEPYKTFQNKIIEVIKFKLENSNNDKIILTSIENAYFLEENLKQQSDYRVYIYGDDFLEEETAIEDKK